MIGQVFPGTRADIRQYLADRGYVLVYTVAGENGEGDSSVDYYNIIA